MIVIGRKDRIDLPELGLFDIEAKVDTGAYGCALHCHHIEVVYRNNRQVLTFKVLDPSHPEYEDKVYESQDFSDKIVRSSTGTTEHRYTIRTVLRIFGKDFQTEFSLTNREVMKHPVLIGRKLLAGRFLVDVKQKELSYKAKSNSK